MKPHFKPITASESNLVKVVFEKEQKDFEYPWHYHPEFELTYILSSQGVRYVGNNIENFYDDDLVLIGSNLPHCWINSPGLHEPASAIVLYFKKEFQDKIWLESQELELINKLFKMSFKGIKFTKNLALRLKPKFYELENLPDFDRFIGILKILKELAITNEFHYLCEDGFAYEQNNVHNDRINTIYSYLDKNFDKKITLLGVASEVNMSEESFSRFFSKTMKKSFFEFLNEYKINKACKLIIETDKQINEICYAAGFESIPFFYRQFKKFKNCQPKLYREKYQSAGQMVGSSQ